MSIRGAEFRKADLQIHSPRDAGWDGARPEDALTTPTAAQIQNAREAYCRDFINKCISEGLRAVAITDHHEGIYVYIAIQTKIAMEQTSGPIDLWIFPGMEITCKDSCQALILFDADLPQVLFEKVRGKLGLPADCVINSTKGIQVELLAQNIEDVQLLLDSDGELRGRFIVLPHVKPDGHKTVLRKGFHKRFKDMPYVGGYMDKCYPHQLSDGDRKILDGEIPAWSSEKRGVISTSDARHADFRDIGKHASWIKLATPTAESIRQAMLAPDSRIRHDDPTLPSVVISSITVIGSKYLGDGTYSFNQQMNSIIGGRGAGKSTLLEYVRFALGCSALDNVAPTASNATTRLSEILEGTQTWEEYEQQLKEFKTIENRLGGHLELLVENGYIDGLQVIRSLDGGLHFGVSNPRLTMAGHDLLDTMRSSTVWNSIKTTAKEKGIELTFDSIKALGTYALSKLLGT